MIVCSGCGGLLPTGAPSTSGRALLHGQDLHRHLHHGDVRQVVGSRFRQILHQRVVLVRLRHRHGKLIVSYHQM